MEDMENGTEVTEIVLVGLSSHPQVRVALFFIFLAMYLVTVGGNGLIVTLIVTNSHLHTPMYFFLSNLSFIDVCYVTTSVPQMLAHCFTDRPIIPRGRCTAQMSIALFLAVAEYLLLAVMAYDRYIAICSPLHYSLIMSRKVCILLASGLWVSSFFLTIVPVFGMQGRTCGRNVVNHFMCELQAVSKLVCSDTRAGDLVMMMLSVFTLLIPFAFILVTYGRIGLAVLHVRSDHGWGKALSTCGSHLVVVVICYGTTMALYLRPPKKTFTNREKVTSVFYAVVIPMLNPLIYSLRNRDVKGALWKALGRKQDQNIAST
ncbi:olfactory receptor 13H1-like [Heteronotia binoei]|uniref:olfactory receptor 13H1-like n=1 Tax=Heteronotia binoei TaxID=13085 RepID=UPI00292DF0F4|nr:olfactory receptor 13H1-like [Heteronotia binoei]